MRAQGLGFLCLLASCGRAREVVFPPISPLQLNSHDHGAQYQASFSSGDDPTIGSTKYAGLSTFANLPWVHCLSPDDKVESYDIAFLGAPFDTATTGRPGARFGPAGIRW
jgi:agmatinase